MVMHYDNENLSDKTDCSGNLGLQFESGFGLFKFPLISPRSAGWFEDVSAPERLLQNQ